MRSVLLALIMFGFVMSIHAQQKTCAVNLTKFTCLEKWSDIRSGSNGSSFVAIHTDSKVTLFLEQLTEKETSVKAYEKALVNALVNAISIDLTKIKIKESDDFWGDSKYSKFEELKGAKVLFDTETTKFLGVHYSVFSYDGKKYIAGVVRLIASGERSKERFEQWIGGGGSGDDNLGELIFLITKEGTQTNLPGGPPPVTPSRLPGGPPPAAPRPKTT